MQSLNKLKISLTLLNTGVLIGLLLFITGFLYIILNVDAENNINNNLQIYCSQLANEIDFLERQAASQPISEEEKKGYQEYSRSLAQNNIAYIIFDETNAVIDQSLVLSFDQNQLGEIASHYFKDKREKYLISNFKMDDKDYKIATYRIVNKDGELKTIQVMKNMEGERAILENTLKMISLAMFVGAFLSFVGGYFLSGRSLVPIKKNVDRQQEFLADASHELRTPISVIQTNLEVVRGSAGETIDSQMVWIDNAYDEINRMKHIVEDLMFLARAESGDLLIHPQAIDLTFLIKVISEKMVPLASKKGIQIINKVEEDLVIVGDEKQITQVFVILLDNAIKYSGEQTIIRIMASQNAFGIDVTVVDQGMGIPQAEIERVTQRFYRVDKARSRNEGGTGLGLAIAKWIIDQHQAVMTIESPEKTGTRINLHFNEGEKK